MRTLRLSIITLALVLPWSGVAMAQPAPQPAPAAAAQFGPAVNQGMAGMVAAQAALEALLAQPELASKIAADAAVNAAMATLQKQAASLQQAAQRLQASAPGAAAPVDPRAEQLAVCRTANARLLDVGHDILHLYEDQSFRALLVKSYEPMLGLWRVKLENIVQDTDDHLRALDIAADQKGNTP